MQTKNKFQHIHIIHYALMAGVFLFVLVAIFNAPKIEFFIDFSNITYISPLFIAIISISLHNFSYKIQLEKFKNALETNEKWNRYQTAHLVRMAYLEMAALLLVFYFYITHNIIYVYIALLLLLIMFWRRPTVAQIAADWNMTEDEVRNS